MLFDTKLKKVETKFCCRIYTSQSRSRHSFKKYQTIILQMNDGNEDILCNFFYAVANFT